MISHVDLDDLATRPLTASIAPTEAAVRRAISARAFNHSAMRNLCEKYARSRTQPLRPPLDRLLVAAPSSLLVQIADAFIQLQTARHEADYDVGATVTLQHGLDMLQVASSAKAAFSLIERQKETAIFLSARLLADRWTRNG